MMVINYLDAHAGALTALLTVALIAVTAYYAVQNRRMVKEMAKARELTILPKLALAPHRLGPTAMTVAVKNVGPGAGLDLDVRVRYEPIGEGNEAEERRWETPRLSATSRIERPSRRTRATASRRNSSGYGGRVRGTDTILPAAPDGASVQVSIKAGALQGGERGPLC